MNGKTEKKRPKKKVRQRSEDETTDSSSDSDREKRRPREKVVRTAHVQQQPYEPETEAYASSAACVMNATANQGKHKVWDKKNKTVTNREPWNSPRVHITVELAKQALAAEGRTPKASA